MGQKKTKEEFIKDARKIHGHKYDYSKVEYVNNKTKVEIVCSKHGSFWQIPDSHLRGRGCPKCVLGNKKSVVKTTDFISKAKKIHGKKYDYSDVEYKNTRTKVLIKCNVCGNEFWQEPRAHLSGQGCPVCANLKKGSLQRSNTSVFVDKAKKVHEDIYDYSKVDYVNNHTKVEIICPIHGAFWQLPHNHLNGKGCPKCGYKKISLKKLRGKEEFIEQAREVHGSKYDYSKVEYKGNEVPVCIICPKHGEFWQTPGNHLSGKSCSKCGKDKLSKLFCKGVSQFVEEARLVHEDKYDYSKVKYRKANVDVEIVCPEHGSFWQRPDHHLNGVGCPKCAHLDSSYEEYLNDKLLSLYDNTDIYREYNEDERYPFKCDFYIKSQDLFIEVNGFWTHGGHWFNEHDEDDIAWFTELEHKAKCSGFYKSAIETWTIRDVKKREHARKNNLNYVVLWNKEDIDEWIAEGYPVRKDWK